MLGSFLLKIGDDLLRTMPGKQFAGFIRYVCNSAEPLDFSPLLFRHGVVVRIQGHEQLRLLSA
jgi:hypothetical protein